VKVLPASATGVLGLANEIDAGLDHRPPRALKILDPEGDNRAGGKERIELIGRTIEFQDRIVAKLENPAR
jgi:hypothetical protein